MPGDDILKKLSQDLTVSEKTSLHLRESLANTEIEPLNLEPAFDYYESSRCKIPEGSKLSYRRYYSREKGREFAAR